MIDPILIVAKERGLRPPFFDPDTGEPLISRVGGPVIYVLPLNVDDNQLVTAYEVPDTDEWPAIT